MKCILFLPLAVLTSLHASVGLPVELVFPAGSAGVSAYAQAVAMNDRHIVVGSPYALGGAGEAHVFSATTGAYLRRLRAPLTAQLGNRVAVSGGRAYLTSGTSHLLAFDVATGKPLWRVNIVDFNGTGPMSLNGMGIDSLAVDGETLLIGMMSAFLLPLGEQGLYTSQGAILALDAATGQSKGVRLAADGQAYGHLGSAVSVAGPLQLAGEFHRSVNGQAKAGRVLLYNTTVNHLPLEFYAPAPAADDKYGAAVAVAGTRFLIGAPEMDHNGNSNNGRVFVHDRFNAQLIKTLNAPATLSSNAFFGGTLAACGNLAAIGGHGNAWLYDCAADQLTPLVPGVTVTSKYGRAVAVCSHSVVVADADAFGGSAVKGRVFLFPNAGRLMTAGQIIARTRKQAPGAGAGTVFAALSGTALSSTGKVSLHATVKGGGATSASNAGVWSSLGGTQDLVLREGDVVDGKRFAAPVGTCFSESGMAGLFMARQSSNGRLHVFHDSGATFSRLVGEGDLVGAGMTMVTLNKFGEIVPCSFGSTYFAASFTAKTGANGVTKENDSWIGRRGGSTFLQDAREGQPSPVTGFNYGQLGPQVSAHEDHLAFLATLAGASSASNKAVIVKNLSSLAHTVSARRGGIANGAGAAVYSTFTSVQMQKSQVVYKATLSGGASGVTSGLWRNGGAVAVKNTPAPGMPAGVVFRRLLDYFNAGSHVTIFRAQVSGPGITSANDAGIWVNSPSGTQLLLREGATVPNSGGLKVGVIQRLDADVTSYYTVLVSLTGADKSRNQALLAGAVGNPGAVHAMPSIVLHKGTILDKTAPARVQSLSMASNHIDRSGAGSKTARQINAHGILVRASFADGTDLLLIKR